MSCTSHFAALLDESLVQQDLAHSTYVGIHCFLDSLFTETSVIKTVAALKGGAVIKIIRFNITDSSFNIGSEENSCPFFFIQLAEKKDRAPMRFFTYFRDLDCKNFLEVYCVILGNFLWSYLCMKFNC